MLTPSYENDPCKPAVDQDTPELVAAWLADFFQRHPEVSRRDFLLHAIQSELAYRQRRDTAPWPRTAHASKDWGASSAARRTQSPVDEHRAEDLVAARLMALNYQRHGLWPRFQRFMSGNWNESPEG